MTSNPDSILPEGYYRWPPAIQRQFIEQLYLLYFPERVQQAAITAATPQPGDDDAVLAEIAE